MSTSKEIRLVLHTTGGHYVDVGVWDGDSIREWLGLLVACDDRVIREVEAVELLETTVTRQSLEFVGSGTK